MIIRKAEEKDLDQLLELYDRLYNILIHEYQYPFDFSRSENAEVLKVQIKSKFCCIFVAEEDGVLRGFVHGTISKLDRRLTYNGQKVIARIDEIYVDDALRGSGAAGALIQEAESWFRSEEVEVVESYILNKNMQSLRFHEKMGFDVMTHRMLKKI